MRDTTPGSNQHNPHIEVAFRPAADREFRRRFADEERDALLLLLVESADSAEVLEQGTGARLKRLTFFGTRFEFVDMRDTGRLLVQHVSGDDPDPPAPKGPSRDSLPKTALKVTAGGAVAAVVRWALEKLTSEHVDPQYQDDVLAAHGLRLEIYLQATCDVRPNPSVNFTEVGKVSRRRQLSSNVRPNPSLKASADKATSALVSLTSNVRPHVYVWAR